MADIKTRNVIKGTIKTIDKASIAGQRMKTSYAKTKQHAAESYSSDDNPVEYASGRISDTASRVLNKGTNGAVSAGHQSAKAARAAAVNLRKNAGEKQLKKSVYKGNVRDLTLRENGKGCSCEIPGTCKGNKERAEEELLSFEEGVGIGSTDIVKVAGTQIGNWNGRKFWSWYGFGSRKYKPRPGDIIFFDWYGDGSRDHVGIVESCDGRYVHTIEGNSSNLCRRKTYPVGWYEIYGYGVPKYPGVKDNKNSGG